MRKWEKKARKNFFSIFLFLYNIYYLFYKNIEIYRGSEIIIFWQKCENKYTIFIKI